ncbi:MFS transporter [Rhodospirillum rubrum]|uniref:Major facilitator superfamily MFS_1 n=1 Tax=Rhodospirillum rubrum (strain ATCC 11170 / ATH 1.1.1 / DSM 467 / LMG 4362 / NCIMB 8255 / S1) TaxID=269796 RepID=Q2RNI4_RHORT|nr:MFS transporter [Rhodospirillum rubrum]ABC24311.1 Major facilitator superfamily MFS_1 [Rhodospirillum rubrum ATCC 11170]AEO50062.1 major facilitator transporter [Rhodospirillum rubrum F11]MBK5956030.1 MFS transporter [Rhodospirillum rubrum]QXG80238.1 MFS transporter [Rhodospirillum rubrum]HAP98734.1 MFS transporter [Rhodospirillum rubrum]
MPTKRPPAGLHYAWIVAAVTFLVLLVGAGIRATPGILIVPLERDFGWSTATISTAIAVNIFLFGMIGPFAVAVMERFGLRRSVVGALLVLAGGVALTTLMSKPWHMVVLWGLVVGSGSGMIALVLGATVAGRWFGKRRGLVLGLLTASSATGQLIFLPILAHISVDQGWRTMALVVAGAALLLVPLAGLLLRDRPGDLGLPRYGETTLEPPPGVPINPLRRATSALALGLRSRDFWLLSGTFFICGASTNGLVGTHMIAACFDQGIPEVAAAGLLALMGLCDLVGTTASGWLTDRYDSRVLLIWYYGLRGVSLLFLPYAFDLDVYGLSLFAVFYGLDWIATVPPTVRLAGQAFGEGNAALMFGWIAAAHQIGAATAAWAAGALRTASGVYDGAFFSAGLLCLIAVVLVVFIGRGPRQTPIGRVAMEKP